MTLIETIEASAKSLPVTVRFEYCDRWEFNLIADRIMNGDYPVCLLLPYDSTDTRANAKISTKSKVYVLLVDKIVTDTILPPYSEIEAQTIEPMRKLMRQLVNKIDASDIIDPVSKGIESVEITPEIGFTDTNLYGVMGAFTIPYSEGLSTCF